MNLSARAQVNPVRLYAAGSLRAAMNEIGSAYTQASGTPMLGEFGASGLLRERIESGEAVDVFASANMAHPQKLLREGKGREVRLFTRNRLCALVSPKLKIDSANLLDAMLASDIKLGVSTPKADPSGDYAVEVFDKADRLCPGAGAVLKARALQLTGGPHSPKPLGERNTYGVLVSEGQADIFLTYCNNAQAAQKENPALQIVSLPPALAVGADYGLIVLSDRAEARELAVFILSAQGQGVLARHGFVPID